MMTRVTAPISQLTRTLAAAPSVPRPALASKSAKVAASIARTELSTDARTGELADSFSRRNITTAHRPTPSPEPSKTRIIPLMQTFSFRTTSPASTRLDTSTIDFAVMPVSSSLYEAQSDDPFANIRVPLSPDNFSLEGHEPETPDAPLAAPEIIVAAANPENVSPAALTEVEGFGIDGIELNFAHDVEPAEREPGMLTDLWKGLVDDVFGDKKVAT